MNDKRRFFCCWLFFVVAINITIVSGKVDSNVHYNIPDPDCSGPFGLCTQEDKDKLGYLAVKKLHEKMDDDRDGQVEVQETKEFMTEELQYKNGMHEREQKFHGSDSLISVEEMWKSWQYSQVYNWTTEDVISWLNEHVKLPQYVDYFRRNRIDGQFMPRLAVNENNYLLNVMQIRDSRHKRLLMVKSTDLVLFGQQQKPYNLVKDVLMIGALTLSIFFCIYLYSKHRQSLEQIKKLMSEFDKLSSSEEIGSNLINQIKNSLNGAIYSNSNNTSEDNSSGQTYSSTLSLFNLKKKSLFVNESNTGCNTSKTSAGVVLHSNRHLKDNQLLNEKNTILLKELNVAKQEAESLRKERETADGQLKQLELAEKELDKVRAALRQTETRVEMIKYQPPSTLIALLNRTYESEKELIEYKYKLIEKEKEACYDALNKISKRQSGLLGALKIAHSSNLEEINNKIEKLKRELARFKSEKQEWLKRWSSIDEICNRTESHLSDSSSQEFPSQNNSDEMARAIQQPLNSPNENSSTSDNGSHNHQLAPPPPQQPLLPVMNSVSTILSKKIYQAKSISSIVPLDETSNRNNNKENVSKVEFDLQTSEDGNNNNMSTVNFNGLTSSSNGLNYLNDKRKTAGVILTTSPFQPVGSVGVVSLLNKTTNQTNSNNFLSLTTSTTTTTTVNSQKIARDSLIHKNDVFQFDDVESVHTHDSLFKHTPHSSFESDDTYKSSLNMDDIKYTKKSNNLTAGNYNKLTQSDNKLMTHLITPILRSVNGSGVGGGSNGLHLNGKSTGSFKTNRKTFRPQSISSNKSNTSPVNNNMKKSVTSSIIENNKKNITESVSSLDRRNTFSKHLSSLRRLINSKSGTAVNGNHHPTTPAMSNLSTPNKHAKPSAHGSDSLFIPIDDLHKSNSVDFIPIVINSSSSHTSIGNSNNDNNNGNVVGLIQANEKENLKKPRKLFKFTLNKKKASKPT